MGASWSGRYRAGHRSRGHQELLRGLAVLGWLVLAGAVTWGALEFLDALVT